MKDFRLSEIVLGFLLGTAFSLTILTLSSDTAFQAIGRLLNEYSGLTLERWERQLEHLKKNTERQLGAYIGIEWCKVASSDWGNTFNVELRIKNTGQTPAYDVKHRITAMLQIVHGGKILGFKQPERSPVIISIAPGMMFTLELPLQSVKHLASAP
jgi:hypothetical protein